MIIDISPDCWTSELTIGARPNEWNFSAVVLFYVLFYLHWKLMGFSVLYETVHICLFLVISWISRGVFPLQTEFSGTELRQTNQKLNGVNLCEPKRNSLVLLVFSFSSFLFETLQAPANPQLINVQMINHNASDGPTEKGMRELVNSCNRSVGVAEKL